MANQQQSAPNIITPQNRFSQLLHTRGLVHAFAAPIVFPLWFMFYITILVAPTYPVVSCLGASRAGPKVSFRVLYISRTLRPIHTRKKQNHKYQSTFPPTYRLRQQCSYDLGSLLPPFSLFAYELGQHRHSAARKKPPLSLPTFHCIATRPVISSHNKRLGPESQLSILFTLGTFPR